MSQKLFGVGVVTIVLIYAVFLYGINFDSTKNTWDTFVLRYSDGNVENVRVIEPKMILYWEKVWSTKRELDILQSCPELKKKCIIHGERRLLDDADVVVFHGRDTNLKALQNIKKKVNQQFVLYNMESPMNIYIPAGSTPKYFFDQTMTYMASSEYPARYGTEWLTEDEAKERGIPFKPPFLKKSEILRKRTHHIAATISNCDAQSHRHQFLTNLRNKTFSVYMVGKCAWEAERKNVCKRGSGSEDCARGIVEDSYFFSALENSICTDYVTEKYWWRASWNSVPIAWSRDTYRNQKTPPRSIIFVDDYANFDKFTDHLHHLMKNETAYLEYFEWRKYYTYVPEVPMDCDLCRNVLRGVETKNDYRDVVKWFVESSKCDNELAKRLGAV